MRHDVGYKYVARPLPMSFLWHFSSYDHAKLGSLTESAIADALLWDDGAFDNVSSVQRLAQHIASAGISYSGLSATDAALLDELIPMMFSPEGLESELALEPESDDGLAPTIVSEMVEHLPTASCLRWLVRGRRHGSESFDVECNYVILSPTDVTDLLAECASVMDSSPDWSQDYVPDVIRECLIDTLTSIQAKGKYAIGALG